MSYVALYRKFRPGTFDEVKGQGALVTTLKNQIISDRIGHAYLFCGTRGTGKTSVAKIFAKAVNCESPVDGSPCGECAMCRQIASGQSMNVIEIDAASNNGVDNIREIREEVTYRPTTGRYKVYIIDEVHMLSAGAFNALLKTLEEPPSYVIFILATTEAHKIPVTILSRCQRYDFKRITLDTIAARLSELAGKEGWEVEEKGFRYIARAADGSMRDALSLLDQCAAFHIGEKLTYDHILEVMGAVDTELYGRLLRQLLAASVKELIGTVDTLTAQGKELTIVASEFTWYLRNLLLLKSGDNMEDALDVSTENMKLLREEAGLIEYDTLLRYIRIFSELVGQLRNSTMKRVLFEMALIKVCKPQMEVSTDALAERIREIEQKLERGIPAAAAAGMNKDSEDKEAFNDGLPQAEILPDAVPEDLQKAVRTFPKIRGQLSGMVQAQLRNVTLSIDEKDNLLFVLPGDMQADFLTQEGRLEDIKNRIEEEIKARISVRVVSENKKGEKKSRYPDLSKIAFDIVEEEDF